MKSCFLLWILIVYSVSICTETGYIDTLAPQTHTKSADVLKSGQTYEKLQARVIGEKLREPVTTQDPRILQGGYGQVGYGIGQGAANNGSFARKGNQGYYTEDEVVTGKTGRDIFLDTVQSMREFFERREKRNGKPIKYIIKPGIGGQHTPFQGIADVFQVIDPSSGKIVGEYELGKNFEETLLGIKKQLGIDWDQIAIIPSSKSGSTDETMMIFVEIFWVMLKYAAIEEGVAGDKGNPEYFADVVLETMREANFDDSGKELKGADLFKKFDLGRIVDKLGTDKDILMGTGQVQNILARVLGNMFFETTDRPAASRLSAFIRNSGLGEILGEDAPGFGAMFDNVGGRWTGDLHMMTFLAYYKLDAEAYWQARSKGIDAVNDGQHTGVQLGDKILDEGITDIALIVPDEMFWFGKAIEQNFNESIWQEGFANLVAIRQSDWENQKHHYVNQKNRLVINLSSLNVDGRFNEFKVRINVQEKDKQKLAINYADLFTTFYGMTSHVGNRLIARALYTAGYSAADVDINNLDHPATQVLQKNLYLRQPFVELGKGLLEKYFTELQQAGPQAIEEAIQEIVRLASQRQIQSNGIDITLPDQIKTEQDFVRIIAEAVQYAENNGLKLVPFIYLEGESFIRLREYLTMLGVEWVMQGTGDQHISYQQILAQPHKYFPLIISIVPPQSQFQSPRPAVGFAKGYLHQVSPNLVRDKFAEFSYKALVSQQGAGIFMRLTDSDSDKNMLKEAFRNIFMRLFLARGLPRRSSSTETSARRVQGASLFEQSA